MAIAYLIVIMTPQYIWWWNFQGLRPAMVILLPTILGFLVASIRQHYDWRILGSARNFFILVLWIAFNVSYLVGPYVDVGGPYRFVDPTWAFELVNKMFVLYFVAAVCINNERNLKVMVYVLMFSGAYLIYWANSRYLAGQYTGRMPGPVGAYGEGIYRDENNFAMMFVVVLPFLWNIGFTLKKNYQRWGTWLLIPFGWHAIFLTGSRGGLVGVAATMALTILRSRNKKFAFLLIPAFVAAFFWQAGDVMLERAGTISEYETESSAASRLEAWEAAVNMMGSHPLTGVGLASFGPAFPDHSQNQPREAHNTFFQIAAEAGVIAGLMYVLIVAAIFLGIWRNGRLLSADGRPGPDDELYWINESILVGFFGLVVCSMFLSLQFFEIFYFFAVLANVTLYLSRQRLESSLAESSFEVSDETTGNADHSSDNDPRSSVNT